jgi:hypothetical protein
LQLQQDVLVQLADVDTQRLYLEDVPEVSAAPEPIEEQELVDVGITIEEDEEILQNQRQGQ